MNHIQVSIEAGEDRQDVLIALLSDLQAVGFEQTATHLVAYFPENDFPSYDVSAVLDGLIFHTTTLAEKNWNEEWEKNFDPVVVDDFCAVRAHFHPPIESVQHEIVITPKMSFGTGHHATTFMMMRGMRALDLAGKRVFDFGTGTGVLAILAEMRGAASVLATDNDEWSIRNGVENAENNGCTKVRIELNDSIPMGEVFDVILANINRNVILAHLPALKTALAADGRILFSGLMTSDGAAVVEACEALGLTLVEQNERANWISLLFVNGM
jgi:ribosomal protein L11 methyltransferase